METFRRMEHNSNADRCMDDAHDYAEVVRVEVGLAVVVSLRPKGAAFGQTGCT